MMVINSIVSHPNLGFSLVRTLIKLVIELVINNRPFAGGVHVTTIILNQSAKTKLYPEMERTVCHW